MFLYCSFLDFPHFLSNIFPIWLLIILCHILDDRRLSIGAVHLSRKEKVTGSIPVVAFFILHLYSPNYLTKCFLYYVSQFFKLKRINKNKLTIKQKTKTKNKKQKTKHFKSFCGLNQLRHFLCNLFDFWLNTKNKTKQNKTNHFSDFSKKLKT